MFWEVYRDRLLHRIMWLWSRRKRCRIRRGFWLYSLSCRWFGTLFNFQEVFSATGFYKLDGRLLWCRPTDWLLYQLQHRRLHSFRFQFADPLRTNSALIFWEVFSQSWEDWAAVVERSYSHDFIFVLLFLICSFLVDFKLEWYFPYFPSSGLLTVR